MSAPRILFYVQHLLGIGHLKRAATIARALSAAGFEVTLVSGGTDVPVLDRTGFRLVQLPAVRAVDRSFAGLVDDRDEPVDVSVKDARRELLLGTYDACRPDLVIVEQFPFGRRQLRFELIPLIERARADVRRPKVISSVRDVLVQKNRPKRDAEMVTAVNQWFDAVMVHGDPDLLPFDLTFPLAREIAAKIHYTGYIVEKTLLAGFEGDQGSGEVVVSSGGGATGEALLRTALGARGETPLATAVWRLLAGDNLPEDVFRDLRDEAGEGAVVERARKDFVTLLHNCRISVSQGGYNTVMEVLGTGARAVVVPYAGGHETEQTVRARLLAERGFFQVIAEEDLTVTALAAAIARALASSPPAPDIDMNGAAATAEFVANLL
jgi:predicted glycosyltransferase